MARSLILFLLARVSVAYTRFETECTHPPVTVNFVSSVDSRGTPDILWSSLFTIVACTWSVLQLDLPEQREGRDPGWRGDIKWVLKRSLTNAGWMAAIILAPEFLLGSFFGRLQVVIEEQKAMKQIAAEDGVPWTLTHAFMADMGGFIIRSHESKRICRAKVGMQGTVSSSRTEQTHASGSQHTKISSDTGQESIYHLSGRDILTLRQSGLMQRLPYISLEEIEDRSKSDSLIRVIAIIQIAWSVVQACVRQSRHLAISQLELAVIAFAACAILMYALNWFKPKGVQTPIMLITYPNEVPREVMAAIASQEEALEYHSEKLQWLGTAVAQVFTHRRTFAGSSTYSHSFGVGDIIFALCICIVFNGIHLVAWNFDFPSKSEQILWRVSTLWCACGFIVLSFLWLLVIILRKKEHLVKNLTTITVIIYVGLYVIARLYVIVEIFRSLCFLPPSAYYSTWATNIPHVA